MKSYLYPLDRQGGGADRAGPSGVRSTRTERYAYVRACARLYTYTHAHRPMGPVRTCRSRTGSLRRAPVVAGTIVASRVHASIVAGAAVVPRMPG
eukprot:5105899-Pyramimonas_sp.AAC.1